MNSVVLSWDWKPSVVIGCAALLVVYGQAVGYRLNRRSVSWMAGVLLILLALVSPLDELADRYLFSAHMAKHILFVLIVPALLLLGLPRQSAERMLQYPAIAAGESILGSPPVAWIAGVGAMVVWHIPFLFEAASSNRGLHIAEHLSLLVAGTVFWWPILAPAERCRMQPVPQGIAYLFSACLACSIIGVLITFSPRLLYPAYSDPVDTQGMLATIRNDWGISAAMDQQIGGLLMWVPCCFVYLTAILAMFARWHAADSNGDARWENKEAQWT